MPQVAIYTASKMLHAAMWREIYEVHDYIHWTSRWPYLEPFVNPTPANAQRFWQDDLADIVRAQVLILFAGADGQDQLRGGLIEAGMALALSKPVVTVGDSPHYGTWRYHPLVANGKDLVDAIGIAVRAGRHRPC